jgi:hypothetical protein
MLIMKSSLQGSRYTYSITECRQQSHIPVERKVNEMAEKGLSRLRMLQGSNASCNLDSET